VRDVAAVVRRYPIPVSLSVMLTRYSLMIPFWCSNGGGTQDINSVLESIAVITTPSGANVGAGTTKKISQSMDNILS